MLKSILINFSQPANICEKDFTFEVINDNSVTLKVNESFEEADVLKVDETISEKYVINVGLNKKWNNVKKTRKAINAHNLYLTKKEKNVKLYVGLIEAYRRFL